MKILSLLELDDNLLYEVFLELINDQSSLLRLSLASRRCSEHVRPILFRHLHRFSPHTLKPIAIDSCTISLICRSLEQRPSLAPQVQSIFLKSQPYNEETRQRINVLLPNLTGLKSLSVSIGGEVMPFSTNLLEINPSGSLLELDLGSSKVKVNDLLSFIFRRSLRVLSVQNVDLPFDSNALGMIRRNICQIRKLNLGNDLKWLGFHLQMSTLATFLNRTKNLQKLSCRIPARAEEIGRNRPYYMMSNELSPKEVEQSLHCISSTLVELDIGGGAEKWPSHDGSRLDFREFTALKKASVASRLFFKSPIPLQSENDCSREGLYKLLPPKLEYFKIYFEFNSAFISLDPPISWETRDKVGFHPDMKPWTYRWCLEIAENKTANFPHLETFKIVEELHRRRPHGLLLELPVGISSLFDSNHIKFSIQCRGPNPGCNGRVISQRYSR